jgi:hypothetical protein
LQVSLRVITSKRGDTGFITMADDQRGREKCLPLKYNIKRNRLGGDKVFRKTDPKGVQCSGKESKYQTIHLKAVQ